MNKNYNKFVREDLIMECQKLRLENLELKDIISKIRELCYVPYLHGKVGIIKFKEEDLKNE